MNISRRRRVWSWFSTTVRQKKKGLVFLCALSIWICSSIFHDGDDLGLILVNNDILDRQNLRKESQLILNKTSTLSPKLKPKPKPTPPPPPPPPKHHIYDRNRVAPSPKKRVIWSRARGDRSGAFIQDMLMCHAYAFHNNFHYGGVCGRDTNLQWRSRHKELIEAVGLSKVLRFNCPSPVIDLQYRRDYIMNDTAIFTSDYVEYLRGLIEYPPRRSARRMIAVHIRRGDITPCRPRTRGYPRYLPNQHFLRLIDRYDPKNESDVFIYSEAESFETFDEFHSRGYNVVLDGSIGEVWKGILISDVVILSRSSFSLVPAVMTKGSVVFTPFWHEPLSHWDIVEEAFVNETLAEFRRLKATCPPKKGK